MPVRFSAPESRVIPELGLQRFKERHCLAAQMIAPADRPRTPGNTLELIREDIFPYNALGCGDAPRIIKILTYKRMMPPLRDPLSVLWVVEATI